MLGLQPYPRTCTDVSSIGLIAATHVQETSKARARKATACLRCSRSLRSFARRRCSPVPRARSCSRRSGARSLMRPQLPRATAASSPVRPPLPIPPAPHSSARPPARAAAPPFTAGVGPRYITRRPELSWSCTRHSACSQIRVATGCGRRDARAVPPWQVKSSAACGDWRGRGDERVREPSRDFGSVA